MKLSLCILCTRLQLDCTDELPSDYLDSVCFNQWNFTSCEKIKKDVSGCNDLWLDTECTNHTGYIRDTCQKSCNNCKGVPRVDIYLNDYVKTYFTFFIRFIQ